MHALPPAAAESSAAGACAPLRAPRTTWPGIALAGGGGIAHLEVLRAEALVGGLQVAVHGELAAGAGLRAARRAGVGLFQQLDGGVVLRRRRRTAPRDRTVCRSRAGGRRCRSSRGARGAGGPPRRAAVGGGLWHAGARAPPARFDLRRDRLGERRPGRANGSVSPARFPPVRRGAGAGRKSHPGRAGGQRRQGFQRLVLVWRFQVSASSSPASAGAS